VYALFSVSGFTRDAQDFALAQQISLIDLSGASFRWLRHAVADAAARLASLQGRFGVSRFPVSWMRAQVRDRLGTAPDAVADVIVSPETNAPMFAAAAGEVLDTFAGALTGRRSELLLGFPAAPFIRPLATDDPERFVC
jgi:hypothetical protein